MTATGPVDGATEAGTPRGGRRPRALAALRFRNFAFFWFGALVSNTGTWVQNVTVPYVIFQLTGSAAWVGLAAFSQLLPMAVLTIVGGAVADRYQRRSVLLVTQAAAAGVALGMWGLWVSGAASVGTILALVVVGGAVMGINIPSWQAFVTELVPREALLNAITLNSTQFNAARAFGPALGGLVLAQLGVGWAFLLNALSFGAVLLALAAIRVTPILRDGPREGIAAGLVASVRYVRRHRGLLACVLGALALGLLASPITALLVVFAEEVFEVGRLRYGLLGAAMGVGSILAAPLLAGPGSLLRRSQLAGLGIAVHGGALVAFALSPSYLLGLAMLVLVGMAYLPIAATLNTSLQLQVEERRRGKVVAVYIMALTVAMPIGALVQGSVASAVGAPVTVAVAASLFLVSGVVLARRGLLGRLDDEEATDG